MRALEVCTTSLGQTKMWARSAPKAFPAEGSQPQSRDDQDDGARDRNRHKTQDPYVERLVPSEALRRALEELNKCSVPWCTVREFGVAHSRVDRLLC